MKRRDFVPNNLVRAVQRAQLRVDDRAAALRNKGGASTRIRKSLTNAEKRYAELRGMLRNYTEGV